MKIVKESQKVVLKDSPGVLLWFDVVSRPSMNR